MNYPQSSNRLIRGHTTVTASSITATVMAINMHSSIKGSRVLLLPENHKISKIL
jgi:hypothetical protein